ncbi:MAG: hypothetical protein ACOC0D_03585 [Spirochaeta sp.]
MSISDSPIKACIRYKHAAALLFTLILATAFTGLLFAQADSRIMTVKLPIYLREAQLLEADVQLNADTYAPTAISSSVLQELQGRIRGEIIQGLKEDFPNAEYLTVETLDEAGMHIKLDERESVIRILPVRDTLIPTRISLQERMAAVPTEIHPGARLSWFANAHLALSHHGTALYTAERPVLDHEFPVQFALDAGSTIELFPQTNYLNMYGSALYDSEHTQPFALETARLRWDLPKTRLRIEGGTLSLPQFGLVRGHPVLGAGIMRDDSLQPRLVTTRMGSTSLYLDRPSQIRVLVNSRPVDQLELSAGEYRITEIPLSPGTNKVELEITDDLQRSRTVSLTPIGYPSLLRPGYSRFAAAVGVHRDFLLHPQLSGYYQRGISNHLTMGASVAASLNESLVSFEALAAAPLGNFSATLGGYTRITRDSPEFDAAGQLEYRLRFPQFPKLPDAAAGIRVSGPKLRTPSPRPHSGSTEFLMLYTTIGQAIGSRFSMSSTLRGVIRRNSSPSSASASITTHTRIGNSGSLSARASLELWESQPPDVKLSISYSYAPGASAHKPAVSVSHNVTGNRTSVATGMSLYESDQTTVSGSASMHGLGFEDPRSPYYTPAGAGAAVRLRTPVLESSIRTDYRHNLLSETRTLQSSLRGGIGIVFADGTTSLSRPNRGAFVIAVPHPSMRDLDLRLSTELGGGSTGIHPWGSGAIPNLLSYGNYSLYADAPILPEGYTLGEDPYHIHPGFQQGTVITLGSGATVLLAAILTDAGGKPIPLAAGRVYSLSPSSEDDHIPAEGVRFFSSRDGSIEIYGLNPGEYRIETRDGRTGSFTIPPQAAGRFHMEAISVE